MTTQLLAQLDGGDEYDVVEFAPGLGAAARLTLARNPRSYVDIDREPAVARRLTQELGGPSVRFLAASAEVTGLASGAASLVYGEATLSMQTPEQKRRILRPGGRYGIHELALGPDDIDAGTRKAIEREMSMTIHVGVRPARLAEWRQLLGEARFQLEWQTLAPMHLLEPRWMLQIACHLPRKPAARQRVFAMRRMFRQYAGDLSAVAIVCSKPLR